MEQLQTASNRVVGLAKKPFVKRTLIALVALVVIFGLTGYFILPGVAKGKAEAILRKSFIARRRSKRSRSIRFRSRRQSGASG